MARLRALATSQLGDMRVARARRAGMVTPEAPSMMGLELTGEAESVSTFLLEGAAAAKRG